MKLITKILLVFFVLLLPVAIGFAKDQQPANAQYLKALQTVNVFLYSWINRDADTGIKLISPQLVEDINDNSWVTQFVVGLSNPHHQAFEVGKGRKTENGNGFIFPVVCYELSNSMDERIGYSSEIEVTLNGNGYKISKLPISSDNL